MTRERARHGAPGQKGLGGRAARNLRTGFVGQHHEISACIADFAVHAMLCNAVPVNFSHFFLSGKCTLDALLCNAIILSTVQPTYMV